MNFFDERMINAQFVIAGYKEVDFKYIMALKDGKEGKKHWWELYKFENEEQYWKWREDCLKQIKKARPEIDGLKYFIHLDFKWGMCYGYKEGKDRKTPYLVHGVVEEITTKEMV